MGKYATIIFDLDGVLIEHDYSKECEKICEILNIPFNKDLENEYYHFWSNFNNIFVNKRMSEGIFIEKFEEYVDYFKLYGISGASFFNALSNNDSTIVKRHNYENLLENLRESGLRIVALTDWFYNKQISVLRDLGYLDYFDAIYTFDNWYMKPDIRAINRIISGKNPDNYILVGDSLVADIACANIAKVKSVWYNESGKKNDTIFVPNYEINDLEKLLEIIE